MKEDQILVALKQQYFSCGKIKLYKGAIVKAASDEDLDWKLISVYISQDREENDDFFRIDTGKDMIRLATEKEIEMWYKGIRNCEEVLQ
jgi:hypothetical protein